MPNLSPVLLAEDNPNDVMLVRRAFQENQARHPLQVVGNGHEAIQYLGGVGPFEDRAAYPFPVLFLLDLKMPVKDGLEVLQWLHEHPEIPRRLPVVVLTSSNLQADIDKSRQFGVYDYRVKPTRFEDLVRLLDDVRKCWLDERFNRFCSAPHGGAVADKKAS